MKGALDRHAISQGAWVALVFAVPFSLLARWLADRDTDSPWPLLLTLLAVGGFTLGAGVAAWVQTTGYPYINGIVCATFTFIAAQLVFAVVKLLRGGDVNVVAVMFNLTVVVFAGLIGGALGGALQKQGFAPRGGRGGPS